MSETQSRILEDDQLFETLLKLKELAPDEAMAVARHIGARSIQRKEIEAERNRLAAELALWKDRFHLLNSEAIKRQADLSAARADAERYRWLRERGYRDGNTLALEVGVVNCFTACDSGAVVDAVVDAARAAPSAGSARPCTCHPDDNPPVPCPRRYALSECRLAAAEAARRALDWLHQTDHEDSAGSALSGMQVVIDPTMPDGTAELRCGESRVPIVPSAGSAPQCQPTLTVCPTCNNDKAKCVGLFAGGPQS